MSDASRPRLVAAAPDLAVLVKELRKEPVLAVDTEAASFHRYHTRIYLIQVSTRTSTAIIDPLAVDDLSAFGALLADPKIEIVFHDADYDLRLFNHQYGIQVRGLFDTRVAAEFLNEPGLSLAALLGRHFEVKVDKRFQRADWSRRPLPDDMLAYAAGDTAHLVALRDLMAERLEAAGRMEWFREECRLLEAAKWSAEEDREPGWLRLKGAKALRPRELAVLRELHGWRSSVADRLDRAEFRILGNDALFAMAKNPPADQDALVAIKGVGKETAERRGKALLAAVKRGLKVPDKDLPRIPRPPRRPREPEMEARLARLKERRTQIARRLELAPGVVCPNSVLEAIARQEPADTKALAAIPGVRQWQAAEFGKDLLDALRSP